MLREHKFASRDFSNLEDVVNAFIRQGNAGDAHGITAACFGAPGPVIDQRMEPTNLPWKLDARVISRTCDIPHVLLLNDLEANGYGIPELEPKDLITLYQGDPSAVGNAGLISAGTGLGEALLVWNGKRHIPVASEGGHTDFAARTPDEIALLQHLTKKLNGRVSYERVISGLGLINIYEFFRDVEKMDEPQWLKDRMAKEDPNLVIGTCGEDGSSELCAATLNLFAGVYGAEAGNIALKVLARGGVYLGGGMSPKLLKTLQNGTFRKAFLDKGRLSPLLETITVRVILDQSCALLGAAAYAESRAAEFSGMSERAASRHQ
jgi:glucokinase